jgi:hypothetical protein
MVEFLEGRLLSKYLLDKYYKNPSGWSFTIFPGRQADKGYGALIGSRDEVWRIQLDSVYNSNPLMVGAKADVDFDQIPKSNKLSYGYRKLDKNAILAILKDMEQRASESDDGEGHLHKDYQKRSPGHDSVIDNILSSIEPVYPRANEAYAEGPIILASRNSMQPIVDRQRDLEDKMSAELRRLLKQKFSAYG